MHACERTITGAGVDADTRNKQVTFKDCRSFTRYIRKINDTQVDHAKEMDIVMLMHYLIEYSYNYMKISGSLWQYHRDDPNDNTADSE